MKSNQVIFDNLSNSGKKQLIFGRNRIATHQIQLVLQRRCSQWRYPSRRHCSLLGPNSRVSFGLSYIWPTHLGERCYELSITHGPWILWPQRPCGLVDVGGGQVPICFQDAWLPHCQRGWGQVAEGAQVQVSRVAWTGKGSSIRQRWKILPKFSTWIHLSWPLAYRRCGHNLKSNRWTQ